MHLLVLNCIRLHGNVQQVYKSLLLRVPVTTSSKTRFNPKLKFLLGLIPVVPCVTAQSEVDKNVEAVSTEIAKNVEAVSPKVVQDDLDKTDDHNGWDKLFAMYQRDEYGNLSKEVVATIQTTSMAFIIGCIYGGVNSSRVAFQDFIKRNQATIFDNHLDAKRRLQNHVTVHFGKGALKWGIRISVFTAGFMVFLTSLSVYRGHISVLDYSLSGALVGGLIRLQLGPPGIIIGTLLGGALGALSGFTTKTMLSLFGSSLDDVISFQYEIDRSRNDLFKELQKKALEDHTNPDSVQLVRSYENRVSAEPSTLQVEK